MKYYLIAGEASGDLHASNLMKALLKEDTEAQFRFFGGDLMKSVGGTLVKHYRDLAYMGFVQVALHARTILKNMRMCKRDVETWQPDVLILVDYAGFNLSIAKFARKNTSIPVYYYISPKIWAWKERRVHTIQKNVTEMFSILPFEIPFYAKYHYPIHYVGNPCVDAVTAYQNHHQEEMMRFREAHGLDERPIIALLAGSRKQEIKDNLPKMLQAVSSCPGFQTVLAGAPGLTPDFYQPFVRQAPGLKVVFGETYALLSQAKAALVTSGTATLETALFRVPQVVCYHTLFGKIVAALRPYFLKVPYISLVNLIVGKAVVPELVADKMTAENISTALLPLLNETAERTAQLSGYDCMIDSLGRAGASEHAAQQMVVLLTAPPTAMQLEQR